VIVDADPAALLRRLAEAKPVGTGAFPVA